MNPVLIEDYDPRWPEQFAMLLLRITRLVGDVARTIEHVGSTAVPGLKAKPIIDMDVLLRSEADLPLAITRLASGGYQHQGDLGVPGREAFATPPNEIAHHLYVCPPDSREYRRHIAFRDHLRGNPDCARRYAELKRALAQKFRDDRDAYTLGKTAFVREILRLTKCD